MTNRKALACLLPVLLAVVVVAGCGGSDTSDQHNASVVLDFVPNAVHAGIYRSIADGKYKEAGIKLTAREPGTTGQPVKLVQAGRATFGISDPIDVASAVQQGAQLQIVGALVQTPLGGVIASSKVNSPAELEGKTVGETGVPSDQAVLDSIVSSAKANPDRVHTVDVGFNGVQALKTKHVDAFVGFWPADGVEARIAGERPKIFRLDANGGPSYPGLVLFAKTETVRNDRQFVEKFVAATAAGYKATLSSPEQSLQALLDQNKGLSRKVTSAQLLEYLPLFAAAGRTAGYVDTASIDQLTKFMLAHNLLKKPLQASELTARIEPNSNN